MQIQANPWSFTSTDQATSVAISSIVASGFSAVVTTGSAHGFVDWQAVSLQGVTDVPAYNGGYKIRLISTTKFYINLTQPNLATSTGHGNALTVAYLYKIRAEQILWNGSAAGTVTLTDVFGNQVYTYTTSSADPEPNTYGKLYWFDGLVINALPNGTVQMTIN
jgi:hypothetical protein